MDQAEFLRRTKRFGLSAIELVESLPRTRTGDVIGRQSLRSATSVGANYRASCRSRSPAERIAKLQIVEEEADGSLYWLEMLEEADLVATSLSELKREAGELLAMTVASKKTLRENHGTRAPSPNRQSTIDNRQ